MSDLTREFIDEIRGEVNSARQKFPRNQRLLAALLEEMGELSQALLQQEDEPEKGKTHEDIWKEAKQVAAVATRIATEGCKEHPMYHPESGYRGQSWPGYEWSHGIECADCDGRGWFSIDMEGSAFYPCKTCNTYEQCPDGKNVRRRRSHDNERERFT